MMRRLGPSVFIAPVTTYEGRVWKSLVRSGADKIYLIKEKRESFKEAADEITKSLKQNATKYLMISGNNIDISREVDLSKPEETYEAFTEIIEREKSREGKILIDVTSATMEASVTALSLAKLYGNVEVWYTPPSESISKEAIKKRVEILKAEKTDLGGEPIRMDKFPSGKLISDEIRALLKINEHGSYNSIVEFANELGVGTGKKDTKDARQRYWTRLINELEEKGLVEIGISGRASSIKLTNIGLGVSKGILKSSKK